MVFGAFDLATADPVQLRSLLAVWTVAAEAMARGQQVPGTAGGLYTSPSDTGEHWANRPAG